MGSGTGGTSGITSAQITQNVRVYVNVTTKTGQREQVLRNACMPRVFFT